MKIAVLGGTFDPVHLGHLLMADEVLSRLSYDEIRFMPARVPPHKADPPVAGSDHRLAMLQLATEDRPEFVVDDFEVRSDGISYTVRTLRHLVESADVDGKPGLIIGEDLVAGFDEWMEADAIAELADIVLVRRPGQPRSTFSRPHTLIDNLMLEISSTEIRERTATALPVRYLLHPRVYQYVVDHDLYAGGAQ